MKNFPEYTSYDALGLAELVRKGEVTAVELCETALNRIDRINSEINAVVTPMFDEGRKTAAGTIPDGPFTGVPFLLKDLGFDYAGYPTSYGNRVLNKRSKEYDSEMVVRYKKAGLNVLGKTNTPEFGLLGVTEPELFGPCRNPWNTERTPGGSSGGSAAAVAAGIVPMASGGDGGGSIRIPSSHCGLFGLKPSRGRNPSGPDKGIPWQGAVQSHVLTRSVRDSAAALDATQGADRGTPYEIRRPEGLYLEEIEKDPGRLKIALNTSSPLGMDVDPQCAKAAEETGKLLESLGHDVVEAIPDIDGIKLARSFMTMLFAEAAAGIADLETILNRKPVSSDVEEITWNMGIMGRAVSAGEYAAALYAWDKFARQMGLFLSEYDLYLTPTVAFLPALVGGQAASTVQRMLFKVISTLKMGWLLKAAGIADQVADKALEKTPFTQLANLTGLPAMSVPLFMSEEGLPVSSQFIAPFGREDMLFRLAAQLEKASPWFDRLSPLAG
ncbi:MAG: amidase [Deltaproteobacteria bacterium]|nr:amidase [Deltaproteobacteria bacterium]